MGTKAARFRVVPRMAAAAIALGGVLTVASVTGVLALYSDTVTTTSYAMDSSALSAPLDLQFAPYNRGCTAFTDGGTTGTFELPDVDLRSTANIASVAFCLRNTGAVPAHLSWQATAVDTELGCTGMEAQVDLAGLGCSTRSTGELSSVLKLRLDSMQTVAPTGCGAVASTIDDLPFADLVAPHEIQTVLEPGERNCFLVAVHVNGQATEEQLQAAQSDRITWRLTFTATEAVGLP